MQALAGKCLLLLLSFTLAQPALSWGQAGQSFFGVPYADAHPDLSPPPAWQAPAPVPRLKWLERPDLPRGGPSPAGGPPETAIAETLEVGPFRLSLSLAGQPITPYRTPLVLGTEQKDPLADSLQRLPTLFRGGLNRDTIDALGQVTTPRIQLYIPF